MGSRGEEFQVQKERWLARGALLAISLSFIAYCWWSVPRLTNYLALDTEFTGWAGPIGERLAKGEIPYEDFVLPIPPGSFAAMAAVQQVAGESLLIQELWVAAIAHLLMGLLAYAIARPFTSRLNALLVTAATLVTVVQISKEIVYDHTAQLVAWTSIAVGVRALLARRAPSAGVTVAAERLAAQNSAQQRMRLWFATGLLSVFTLAFKQTTAVGVTLGWVGALGYLGAVEFASTRSVRRTAQDLGPWALGAAAGFLAVWAVIASLGSSVSGYVQAVFGDAPDLKGGTVVLAKHVVGYLVDSPAFSGSLVLTLLLSLVAVRIARRRPTASDEGRLTGRATFAVTGATCIAFGVAAALLATRTTGLSGTFIYWAYELRMVATFGLAMTCLLFAFGLRRSPEGSAPVSGPEAVAAQRIARGHAFNALFIVALSASLLHNTSIGLFRPFFDNNPIIPVAFAGLFVALDRAGIRWLKPVVMALVLVSLFGPKYQRALRAHIPAPAGTHWEGLHVPERAQDVIRAAKHVRKLTTQSDTVLVLPEDVQLAALIGRPRPPVKGAILFVDQYPTRLLERDRQALKEHPPKVIVIHPSEQKLWQRLFRLWQYNSGTEQMMRYVLEDLIPNGYRKEMTVPTVFGRSRGHLDVWVRVDEPHRTESEATPHIKVVPGSPTP